MKSLKLIMLAFVVLMATQLVAQDLPKKEFEVNLSAKQIVLAAGETKNIEIKLLRSKSYRNTEIEMVVDSRLPEGISITFKDGADPMVDQIMTIVAEANTEPFQKIIIIKGKTKRVSKGVMLDLALDAQTLSSN